MVVGKDSLVFSFSLMTIRPVFGRMEVHYKQGRQEYSQKRYFKIVELPCQCNVSAEVEYRI